MTNSSQIKMPAFDPATIEGRTGTNYPEAMKAVVDGRLKRKLGDAAGLTRFGVNLVTLAPGAASSHRHWHSHEDEFVYILDGTPTLVTDAGEQVLGPGMAAGFPAGVADGHHLVNRSGADVLYLEVGNRDPADAVDYPDVDMTVRKVDGGYVFAHKDGTPY
jgi:uncharacterized cupin superfamily protein